MQTLDEVAQLLRQWKREYLWASIQHVPTADAWTVELQVFNDFGVPLTFRACEIGQSHAAKRLVDLLIEYELVA